MYLISISVPSESTTECTLILYPYRLKVQRNLPNNTSVASERTTYVMYITLYPYLLKVRGNVPNIISVPSESNEVM